MFGGVPASSPCAVVHPVLATLVYCPDNLPPKAQRATCHGVALPGRTHELVASTRSIYAGHEHYLRKSAGFNLSLFLYAMVMVAAVN